MPSKIAAYLNWAPQTVRETIHRWNTKGLGGLWEAPGRGGKPKWQEADIAYLEACLEQEPHTYNAKQLAQKLESDRGCSTESRPHQTGTQKKGVIWKRTRHSNRDKQDPSQRQFKQADLDMLELAAASGEIELKYREGVRLLSVEPSSLYVFPAWATEMPGTNSATRQEIEYFGAIATPRQFCLRSSHWRIYQ